MWDNLANYDQIGRIVLIAIQVAANILVPLLLAMLVLGKFVDFLQCLVDRLESLLAKMSGHEESDDDDV